MSVPTTFNYAVIRLETTDGDPSTLVAICGINATGFNRNTATRKTAIRDCQSPALPPSERSTVVSTSQQLTGTGLYNTDQTAIINALQGVVRTYDILLIDASDPTVPAGHTIGGFTGRGICTALNIGTSADSGEGTISITIESDGPWTYTSLAGQ